jgi:nucleoside-diphosphate-sugar epimerase
MDVSRINQLGWTAQIHLEKGIKMVYEDFKASLVKA